jgi:hypothetical protein
MMTLTNVSGTVTVGSATVQAIFTPSDVRYGPGVHFTAPYYVYKNGVLVASGTLIIKNQQQSGISTNMSSVAESADAVIVYVGEIV